MSHSLHLELNKNDREVLLRGLRYVRSSVMLEFREPSPRDTEQRRSQLQQIASLVEQLDGTPAAARV